MLPLITGRSCIKYDFCHNKHMFVTTKVCLSQKKKQKKKTSVMTKVCLLRQKCFVTTNMCLSQNVATKMFCHDKHVFVTKPLAYFFHDKRHVLSQQTCVCCNKSNRNCPTKVAVTKVCLSWQKFCCNKHTFVATKDTFCCDKNHTCSSSRQW